MTRLTTLAICVSYLACSAGSGDVGRDGARQTRDSAGIQIVENVRSVRSSADAPRLAASPTLVIGDRPEPDYVLSRVGGAVRLSDGRIVVADGSSFQLAFFDSDGRFIQAVGRRGDGPGEFRRLDGLTALAGDTLAALSMPRTVSFFDPRGGFLRRWDASQVSTGLPGFIQGIVAVLSDQTVVVGPLPMPSSSAAGSSWVDSIPLVAIGRDTTKRIRLGTFPYMLLVLDEGKPRPPWFGPTAAFAAGGTSFFAGFGTEYAIRAYSSDGRLERIIRRSWTPVRVTTADIDAYVTEWAKRWIKEEGPEGEGRKRALRDDPYAGEVPAFSQFLADGAGRLWVREAHLADAPASGGFQSLPLVPSVWSVFDRDGQWLGDATMPAYFKPTDIGRDYVLGIAIDSDGVETVVQYAYAAGDGGGSGSHLQRD